MKKEKHGQKKGKKQTSPLKVLCEREGIKRLAFAEMIGLAENSLNKIISGNSNLTEANAERIHQLFPEYSVDWLLGKSKYMNSLEKLAFEDVESSLLGDAFYTFASLNGFTIIHPLAELAGQDPTDDEVRKALKFGYALQRNEDSTIIRLTHREMDHLKEYIKNMVKLQINLLFDMKENYVPTAEAEKTPADTSNPLQE